MESVFPLSTLARFLTLSEEEKLQQVSAGTDSWLPDERCEELAESGGGSVVCPWTGRYVRFASGHVEVCLVLARCPGKLVCLWGLLS